MGCYESSYGIAELPAYADGIVYVTTTGAGNQDGTSWSNAMSDINMAAGIAMTYDTLSIWVAKGTYVGDSISGNNVVMLHNGINMYGGFEGNEPADYDLSQRDFEANATILDGQNVQRVVYQAEAFTDTTYFDGFTVRNGSAYEVGGLYLNAKSYVRNCIITDNYSNSTAGAVYLLNGVLENCVISSNSIYRGDYYYYAGGVRAESSTISHCVITKNRGSLTSGVSLNNSVLDNCLVSNNSNYSGSPAVNMYNSSRAIMRKVDISGIQCYSLQFSSRAHVRLCFADSKR